MKLLRSGRSLATIFDLLGSKENDMSAALAYALSKSPRFLEAVVQNLCGVTPHDLQNAVISIQTFRRAQGITDVEIQIGGNVFLILEAKRDAELPTRSQLSLYAPDSSEYTGGMYLPCGRDERYSRGRADCS